MARNTPNAPGLTSFPEGAQPLPDLSSTTVTGCGGGPALEMDQAHLEGLTVVISAYRQACIYVITLFTITVLLPSLVPGSELFLTNPPLLFGTPIYKYISHLVF